MLQAYCDGVVDLEFVTGNELQRVFGVCADAAAERVSTTSPAGSSGGDFRCGPWLAAFWMMHQAIALGAPRLDAATLTIAATASRRAWEPLAALVALARGFGHRVTVGGNIDEEAGFGNSLGASARCAAAGDVHSGAWAIAEELPRPGIRLDVQSLRTATRRFAEHSAWRQALSRASSAHSSVIISDVDFRADVLESLASARRWRGALHHVHGLGAQSHKMVVRACSLLSQWVIAFHLVLVSCKQSLELGRASSWKRMRWASDTVERMRRVRRFLLSVEELRLPPDPAVCTAASSLLTGSQKWDHAPAVLAAALVALSGVRLSHSPETVTQVVAHGGAVSPALAEHESFGCVEMRPPGAGAIEELKTSGLRPVSVSYNIVISNFASHHWHLAGSLFTSMRNMGIDGDAVTSNAVMAACVKKDHWELSLDGFRCMGRHAVEPDTTSFNAAIAACRPRLHWRAASELLTCAAFDALGVNRITLSTALSACDHALRWAVAIGLFRSLAQPTSGIEANLISQNTLISACARGACWERALNVAGAALARGFSSQAASCAPGIGACIASSEGTKGGSGGSWQFGALLLSNLCRQSLELGLVSRNVAMGGGGAGTQESLGTAAWVTGRMPEDALHGATLWRWVLCRTVADLTAGFALDAVSWNIASTACTARGYWRWGLQLISGVLHSQLKASSVTYGAAADAVAHWAAAAVEADPLEDASPGEHGGAASRQAPWSRLLTLWDTLVLHDVAVTAATCSTVMGAFDAFQQWPFALGCLAGAQRMGVRMDIIACSAAVKACAPTAESSQHWNLAAAALHRTRADELSLDLVVCHVGAKLFGTVSEWLLAQDMLRKAVALGHRVDMISVNLAASALEKVSASGLQAWCRALEVLLGARRMSLEHVSMAPWNSAVSSCGKSYRWETAVSLLAAADNLVLKPDAITLDAAILACRNVRNWEQALALLEDMSKRELRPGLVLFSVVVRLSEDCGQWAVAMSLMSDMQSSGLLSLGSSRSGILGF